jgi:porin
MAFGHGLMRLLFWGAVIAVMAGPQARADVPATQPFDSSQHLTGDWWGARSDLARRGITFDLEATIDDSKNFMGGLDTAGNSIRERLNFGIQFDTERLLGLKGGTFGAVYQLQHGGNAAHELTGDAQNFAFGTNADGRSQLGQLWYEQKFLDAFRLRLGKMDANDDFDVMENGLEFLNNSFSTSPTLGLMPSFPDTATGAELFFEPDGGFYAGAGVYDGSLAHGVQTGEYGPRHFASSPENLFLIAEIGQRYELTAAASKLPGKIGVGGWWDSNKFQKLDGAGQADGNGGAYLIVDQMLWKPRHAAPVLQGTAGQPSAGGPEEEEYPGGIASCFSIAGSDPRVNEIDGSLTTGLTWTGPIDARPIDVWGAGVTFAHFSDDLPSRDPYEMAVEMFYRIRFTDAISLKPDVQYIMNPSGGGLTGESPRNDALVMTLRLEMAF